MAAAMTAALAAVTLCGCGSGTETRPARQAEQAKPADRKPTDESRRFPEKGRTATEVVDRNLLGKEYMPGGTVVRYRQGKREWEMFVAKTSSAQDAALLLLDWKKDLLGSKLVPSFGGYYGKDGNASVFVFAKGEWVAGVRGLEEQAADAQARLLAARL